MSFSSEISKAEFNGNGSSTEFSTYPVVVYSETELEVTVIDENGNETKPALGTGANNFSVSTTFEPNTPAVAEVVYPADKVTPLPAGHKIIIKRVISLAQDVIDLENQGGYLPEIQERGFDRAMMGLIQVQEELDRAVKVTIGSDTDPADIVQQVESIADITTEITEVANIKSDVQTVSNNITDVTAAADNLAAIQAAPQAATDAGAARDLAEFWAGEAEAIAGSDQGVGTTDTPTFNGVDLTGDVTIESGNPAVRILNSNAPSGERATWLLQDAAGNFDVELRDASDSRVSTDYSITRVADKTGNHVFYTDDTERVRIDDDGLEVTGAVKTTGIIRQENGNPRLVLLNTNAPSGEGATWLLQDAAGNFDVELRDASDSKVSLDYSVRRTAGKTTNHIFYTDGTERARIDDTGLTTDGGSNYHVGIHESSEISLSSGDQKYTFNHGQSRIPMPYTAVLRCKTAELGYAAGDEVQLHTFMDAVGGSNNRGVSVWANTTQLGVSVQTNITLIEQDTQNQNNITPANWRLVFYYGVR